MTLLTRFRPQSTPPPAPEEGAEAPARRHWVRRVAGWALTAAATALVLFALIAPNQVNKFTPEAFLRIPGEALISIPLLLVLPPRPRRVVAIVIGAGLGVLTILKVIDLGFSEALDRMFDPIGDWPLLADAVEYVKRSYGGAGAVVAVVLAILLALSALTLMTLAVLRLTRIMARHRRRTIPVVAVFTVAWVACAALGAQLLPKMPIASKSAAGVGFYRLLNAERGLRDLSGFTAEMSNDGYKNTPGDQLLTGLRGKDVMIAFVESYGRVAVQDPQMAPQVGALLDAGYARLQAAGYSARSAFLTSPTAGGGSWLAHSTLMSGVWIDNQMRYNRLLGGDRLTLNRAFHNAGWRTVDIEAALSGPWPQGKFYGSDKIYTASDLGYRGPTFNFRSVPDQFTLSTYQRDERGVTGRPPLFAELVLLSSHSPWAPLPSLVDWDTIGDGSVAYKGMPQRGHSPSVQRDAVRTDYRQSIEYSLGSLLSYIEKYGDKNLVMVFLGDHQPAPIVAGFGASRDVPVTIVAHDPAVLDRISGWGWQAGLMPHANAPVWRMNTFRDRFLSAYS